VVLIPAEPPIYLQAPNGRWFLVRHYVTRTREPALPLIRNLSRTSSNHPWRGLMSYLMRANTAANGKASAPLGPFLRYGDDTCPPSLPASSAPSSV
jgi:hypothetical protein